MITHSSFLAWKIPWTEEPDGLQSMGSQSQRQLNTHTGLIPSYFISYVSFLFRIQNLIERCSIMHSGHQGQVLKPVLPLILGQLLNHFQS